MNSRKVGVAQARNQGEAFYNFNIINPNRHERRIIAKMARKRGKNHG